MVGQKKLLSFIDTLFENNKVPSFIIICGSKGSGKTMLAKYIANKLSANFALAGIKVDEIRQVIDIASTVKDKTVYCIQDADTMRNEAKNAMLKITEEPPANAQFVMTIQDDSTLLDTIKSRATIFYLEPYTNEELKEYYNQNYTKADGDVDVICDIATTPYEIDKLMEYGGDFLDYVELVVDNISEVESANAFKSSNKLALKNDAGYDLKLFWQVFDNVCMNRLENGGSLKYASAIILTVPYICNSMKLGVNKQQLYDSWVFEIRSIWV